MQNLKVFKKNFKQVKQPNYIIRFRNHLLNFGSRTEKLELIKKFVFKKFISSCQAFLPVHDIDLRKWAIQKSIVLNMENFVASHYWLHHFKFEYGIVSRNVTKLVSNISDEANIPIDSNNFLIEAKSIIIQFPSSAVINTDQSGFNYEMYSKRTLSQYGEKNTVLFENSMNAISHSYTIQPVITMEGKLLPKFLICLQEIGGNFGPKVLENFPNFTNVIIKCTKSGKMTKDLVIEFNIEIIKTNYTGNFVYIADSWNGQTDDNMYKELFENKCTFLQIPPNCTALIQPLDVYFFRF